MAHSIACKTFCKSFTMINANDKHFKIYKIMKYVISNINRKERFVSNRAIDAYLENHDITPAEIEFNTGGRIYLYFHEEQYKELHLLLEKPKWYVFYFANHITYGAKDFDDYNEAKAFVDTQERNGVRCKLIYGYC